MASRPKGHVRDDLLPGWRGAILDINPDELGLGNILRDDRSLAHDWLARQIEEGSWIGSRDPSAFNAALSVLSRAPRLALLRNLHRYFVHESLAVMLVGDHLDLYREFLQDAKKNPAHL
jgi:hypothetical protein